MRLTPWQVSIAWNADAYVKLWHKNVAPIMSERAPVCVALVGVFVVTGIPMNMAGPCICNRGLWYPGEVMLDSFPSENGPSEQHFAVSCSPLTKLGCHSWCGVTRLMVVTHSRCTNNTEHRTHLPEGPDAELRDFNTEGNSAQLQFLDEPESVNAAPSTRLPPGVRTCSGPINASVTCC